MKTFKQRQVRVFISSAFRGMGKEREVLIRHVFPEIRRRCFERGVDFVEVDLRWGITEHQVNLGNAVPICFQQIDLCHPYFIGLLGEYYGSTILPDQKKTACANYPWIEYGAPVSRFKRGVYAIWQYLFGHKQQQGYLDRSITELEILYALFDVDPKRMAQQRQAMAEKALFYFRDPSYADTLPVSERQDYIEASPKNRAKQQNLKQRLREHGCHIAEYKQPMNLKALVLEALWDRIEREFPDTPTPQQREDFDHDAFAASRQSLYIKRQADFDRLTEHALSDDPPLVIVGESGGGKSALLANWAPAYRQAHPDELVFWHFCGSSPGSTDPIALLRRIMASLKSHFQFEEELPSTIEAVKEQFPQWLAKAQGRVILIIDGLNQLEETEATRGWLSDFFPDKIRVFLSTLSTEQRSWQLPLLSDKSARQALIREYFKSYGKTLDKPKMQRLLDAPQTANPLYLKVILEELRIFGDFYKLGDHLDAYLQAPSIPALYQKVLARLEEDYQPPEMPDLVEKALSLLWAARWGLHESELLMLLAVPQAIWSPLYLALQNALVSRAGLLNFFHDYLRQAVEARYLSSSLKKRAVHRQLADYFEQQEEVDSRLAGELPYQLELAGEKERLQACISEMPMFLQFIKDDKEYELWGYWLRLGTRDEMVAAYLSGLADYEKTVSQKDLAEALNQLGYFFCTVGYSSAAEPLFQRALEIHEKVLGTEHPDTASSVNNLAYLLQDKGDYSAAEPLYQRALKIREKVLGPEHPDTALSVNNLAYLLYNKGDYSAAEPLFQRALAIYEKVLGPEHPDTASSVNNLAYLLDSKGDYSAAEPLYQRALEIREKVLGPEHPDTAISLNNLALLFHNKGDYSAAEPLYQRALKICEKVLGPEHPDTASSLNNLASLLYNKGDYSAAEPLSQRAVAILEMKLPNHPNTIACRKNLDNLLKKKG